MPHNFRPSLVALAVAATIVLAPAAARAEDDAKAVAVKTTAAGAALFDARDAKGLAATYTDDARIDIYSKEQNSAALKIETKVGRAEIQAYYEELFKNSAAIHAKSTIESARRIDDDLMIFTGVFEPNNESAESLKLPFTQVRSRQGDAWKIVSLQLFIAPQK